MAVTSFDLRNEAWIQVRTLAGTPEQVSLRGLFERAHELREITGDLPTQSFALLRLALAILSRATDGPETVEDWRELRAAGVAPMDRIDSYLAKYADRFDLLHPTMPFFQVHDLRTAKDEVSSLKKLIADSPAGHPFFTTRLGEGLERITLAEAARWVVHVQAFDTSGIKSGAVGDPRVKGGRGYPIGTGWAGALGGLSIEGPTLWETLLLNLIPLDHDFLIRSSDKDRPAWEAEPSNECESPDLAARPYGPLDLFTWQSRRVRLIGDADGITGVVLTNGDKIEPQNHHHREPMTAWRDSAPQAKRLKLSQVYMPRKHDPARSLWRGIGQLLPCAAGRGKADAADALTAAVIEWAAEAIGLRSRVTVRATGLEYGTQNAVVTDLFDDRLTLSIDLLASDGADLPAMAIDAVDSTASAVTALRNLAANLVRAAGGDPSLADGARDRAAAMAYDRLNHPIRQWLAKLDADTDVITARYDWHAQAWRIINGIGDDLIRNAGAGAWIGRTITMQGKERRITSPEAAGWFAAALAKHLPSRPRPEEENAA